MIRPKNRPSFVEAKSVRLAKIRLAGMFWGEYIASEKSFTFTKTSLLTRVPNA
jgi:hypothetical protein